MSQKQRFSSGPDTELDPVISSLAREHKLGALHSVYHAVQTRAPSWMGGWLLLIMSLFYTVPACIVFFEGALSTPAASILSPGFLILALSIYLILPKRIFAHWHLYLWEAGFIHEKGQQRQVFRWDQISKIKSQTTYGRQDSRPDQTFFRYTISHQDNSVVKITNTFPEVARFIGVVLAQYSRQAAEQELQIVPPRDKKFPVFTLDRQGISHGKDILSWQDVQELTIENGAIAVLKREPGLAESERAEEAVHPTF